MFLILFTKAGSKLWFIKKEIFFGGYKTNIPRNVVSINDHRTKEQINFGGMTGGDRMLFHGYAGLYSKYLKPYLKNRYKNYNFLEVGILEGTGLAVWGSTFPNANIFGADIDLKHFDNNKNQLREKADFNFDNIEVFKFDQLNPKKFQFNKLDNILFDIIIDDGLHSKKSILNTALFFKNHLSKNFIYFIEDVTVDITEDIKNIFPDCNICQLGQLVVIENK